MCTDTSLKSAKSFKSQGKRGFELVEGIYDERGVNVSKNLTIITGRSQYRRTLDLGCGLGLVAISRSPVDNMVIAADISKDALRTVSVMIKKMNINNVYPILMDATFLPLRDGIFDLIICNGVLEWVAMDRDFNLPTEKFQLDMLKEVRRVLVQRGVFWLGIENRYSYRYLLGCIDHHSGLRFITLLPRFIADKFSKLIKKQPYRNYLYSYWELIKMLRKIGFAAISFYAPLPYYSNPKLVVPISNSEEIKKLTISSRLFSSFSAAIIEVVSSLRLTKFLFPCFIVLCTK